MVEEVLVKKKKAKKPKESSFIVFLIETVKEDEEDKVIIKTLRQISKQGYYWFSNNLEESLVFKRGDMRFDTIKNNIIGSGLYKNRNIKIKRLIL